MNGLPGRVAIVTGAAHGIGAATARRLVGEGASVLLVDVDARAGQAVADELADGQAVFEPGDVADEGAWRRVATVARRRFGGIDVVVNNAYLNLVVPTVELEPANWRRMLDVNVGQVYLSVRECMPDLVERGGSMINVSSVHAHIGFAEHAGYDASKGAITAMTRQLAVEFGPRVRVNAVLPGPIITSMWEPWGDDVRAASAAMTTLARNGQPDEVAGVIAFLASADASYVTGAEIAVDGGWSITKHTREPLDRHSG